MKCIIYGLGSGRLRVERYLRDEHSVIGYTDTFFNNEFFNNKKFYKPKELYKQEFDVIIIAIGNKEIRENVYENLIKLQIDKNKIIDFYSIYYYYYEENLKIPKLKVDRVIKDIFYDGIVLGISHADLGINPKYLNGKWLNLALGSQDLFYNLKTLQILKDRYFDRIKHLKYVIIDMHKYTYFNYDVSRTKNAIKYYIWSGFGSDEKHNYDKNKNFDMSIEEEIKKYKLSLINSDFNLFNALFRTDKIDYEEMGINESLFRDYPEKSMIDKSISEGDIEKFKKECRVHSIQINRYEDTIKENISIFEQIMNTLIEINPKIKIYLVLIPQHKIVEDFEKNIEKSCKEEFYTIINEFKERYNYRVLDFKNFEKISSINNNYYDLRHLNYEGAKEFTRLLNSYIKYN